MRRLAFDQATIIITGELSSSSALVAKARFVDHERHHILAGTKKFLLAWIGSCWVKLLRLIVLVGVYRSDE